MKNVYAEATMHLVLLEIYKGGFYHIESLPFSTEITDHGPLFVFPYNLETSY